MDRRLLAAALVAPLLLTGCTDDTDDTGDTGDTGDSSAPHAAEATDEPGQGEAPDGDAAIEEAMVEFLLTGSCDLATDEYLVELALFDDVKPDEACAQWESVFVEPSYTEDDIVLSDLESEDGVAMISVGSRLIDFTTRYELTLVDGSWLVSGDEFNSDL